MLCKKPLHSFRELYLWRQQRILKSLAVAMATLQIVNYLVVIRNSAHKYGI